MSQNSMYVTDLDDLIARLTEMRQTLPGSTPVRLSTHGRNELLLVSPCVSRVGKSDPNRRVSRGGIPVVVLAE